jgi:hypothetical protein
MAIFQVTVTAGNNPARTYTVDAADEAAAKKEAIRQAFSQPNARNLRMSQMEVKKEDIVEQFDEGRSNEELQAEKDLAAQLKISADEGYSELAKVGEEAVQTAEMPSFSAYADTLGDVINRPEFTAQPSIPVQNFSQVNPQNAPKSIEQIILEKEQEAGGAISETVAERTAREAREASFNTDAKGQDQTLLGRRNQLESGGFAGQFASYLDELDNAGLGGLQGRAGQFLKNQYDPFSMAYQAEQLLPLGGEVPFGGQREAMGAEQVTAYNQALARQQEGVYEGTDGAVQEAADLRLIRSQSPTFGQYTRDNLEAGGRQAQQRIGQQLQALAGGGAGSDPFAQRMMAPSSQGEGQLIMQLAEQARQGRYSPMVANAMQSYMPSEGELFANYLRESVPQQGQKMASAAPPNFAQYVGQSYGLF